jgi:hypothetical protein
MRIIRNYAADNRGTRRRKNPLLVTKGSVPRIREEVRLSWTAASFDFDGTTVADCSGLAFVCQRVGRRRVQGVGART